MANVAVRREVAAGQSFIHADDMVKFLEQKFPNHFFDVISTKELKDRWGEDTILSVKTIDGSSKFQVVVFTPDIKQIKATPRLCICDNCLVNYGTCDRFTSHDMSILHLNKVALRSSTKLDSSNNENTDETVAKEFVVPGTVVALAADSSSIDTVWFVKVVKVCLSQEDEKDDYGHTIRPGHEHIHGHFLEKISTSTGCHFKLSKKLLSSTKKVLFIPLYNSPKQRKDFRYQTLILSRSYSM